MLFGIADKFMKYTIEEKMSGLDLHGLSCRVPKPTAAQSTCSHTKKSWVDTGFNDWDGNWQSDMRMEESTTCEDIPGTNNFRCTRCGYIRRY